MDPRLAPPNKIRNYCFDLKTEDTPVNLDKQIYKAKLRARIEQLEEEKRLKNAQKAAASALSDAEIAQLKLDGARKKRMEAEALLENAKTRGKTHLIPDLEKLVKQSRIRELELDRLLSKIRKEKVSSGDSNLAEKLARYHQLVEEKEAKKAKKGSSVLAFIEEQKKSGSEVIDYFPCRKFGNHAKFSQEKGAKGEEIYIGFT